MLDWAPRVIRESAPNFSLAPFSGDVSRVIPVQRYLTNPQEGPQPFLNEAPQQSLFIPPFKDIRVTRSNAHRCTLSFQRDEVLL